MHANHTLVENCEICDKTFTTGSHLNRHMDEVHGESPTFTCSFCDYRTKDEGNLKKHVLVHCDTKPFKCDICHFETKRSRELKSHRCRMKPFQCDLCHKRSSTANGLYEHKKRTHSA